MTQYIHEIFLTDGETLMMKESLNMFIVYCDNQIKNGINCPYFAMRDYAMSVLIKLKDCEKQLVSFTIKPGD